MASKVATKYPNLAAEMARKGLTHIDFVPVLGCSASAAHRRLDGESRMTVKDAIAIRNAFFTSNSIEYLFMEGAANGK